MQIAQIHLEVLLVLVQMDIQGMVSLAMVALFLFILFYFIFILIKFFSSF